MTNEQILEKAVQIAMDRGWVLGNLDKWHWTALRKTDTVMANWYYFIITYDGREKVIDAERIIYDHSFAQALWGTTMESVDGTTINNAPATWKPKLMEMVIADDPIKYLGEHI